MSYLPHLPPDLAKFCNQNTEISFLVLIPCNENSNTAGGKSIGLCFSLGSFRFARNKQDCLLFGKCNELFLGLIFRIVIRKPEFIRTATIVWENGVWCIVGVQSQNYKRA